MSFCQFIGRCPVQDCEETGLHAHHFSGLRRGGWERRAWHFPLDEAGPLVVEGRLEIGPEGLDLTDLNGTSLQEMLRALLEAGRKVLRVEITDPSEGYEP